MSDSLLVVVVPTLGRPQAIEPLVTAFRQQTPPTYRMLFVVDPDDGPTWEALEEFSGTEVEALERGGSYPEKINAGIEASEEPVILAGADDIRPHYQWFERACTRFSDKIGFVSLNDLGNPAVMAGDYATLPLVARWYVHEVETLYHEGYQHIGCDVDASRIARARGAFAYAEDAVMEHMHPAWGKAEVDETYEIGGMNKLKTLRDWELFETRKYLWK